LKGDKNDTNVSLILVEIVFNFVHELIKAKAYFGGKKAEYFFGGFLPFLKL